MSYSRRKAITRTVNVIILIVMVLLLVYTIHVLTSGGRNKPQVPTVDLSDLAKVSESADQTGEGFVIIDGTVYKPFCDFGYIDGPNILERIETGDPVAYSLVGGRYYVYYSRITNLPENEWIASFGEDGSAGMITADNGQMLWKAEGAESVPEWLENYRKEYLEATGG